MGVGFCLMERGNKIVKGLVRLLTVFSLLLGCWGWLGTTQAAQAWDFSHVNLYRTPILAIARQNKADQKLATDFGKKIDLNNTNISRFQGIRGFYPVLAKKIIANAPYAKVEDVLEIKGLSDRQKKLLANNLSQFTVTKYDAEFNEGDDRINNGIYR